MTDPLLLLDASSEEDAAWQAVREADQEAGIAHVARARALARAATLAGQAGRADFVADELMACLRIDHSTARRVLYEGLMLTTLPDTCDALEQGRIGVPHARVLVDELAVLTPAQACAVEREVLPLLDDRPPARVRDIVRRTVLRVDPEAADRRRVTARAARRLSVQPDADGMAWIRLLVPAERALAVLAAADEHTRAPDDTGRSADQRRADWALDRLLAEPEVGPSAPSTGAAGATAAAPALADLTSTPPCTRSSDQAPEADSATADEGPLDRRRRRRFQAVITVPVAVALGLSDEPCDLAGYGPITAQHGRELLAVAELRRVCVDAVTGQVVASDQQVRRPVAADGRRPRGIPGDAAPPRPRRRRRRSDTGRAAPCSSDPGSDAQTLAQAIRDCLIDMVLTPTIEPVEPEPQYRPSRALSRTVELRDVTCTFPSCSATSCDDDHVSAWPRGSTELHNLHRQSRHHHRAKQAGWTPRPLPDGSTLWRAPSGRTYRRPPSRPAPPPLATLRALPAVTVASSRDVPAPVERVSPELAVTVSSPCVTIETRRRADVDASRPVTWRERLQEQSCAEYYLSVELDPPPF